MCHVSVKTSERLDNLLPAGLQLTDTHSSSRTSSNDTVLQLIVECRREHRTPSCRLSLHLPVVGLFVDISRTVPTMAFVRCAFRFSYAHRDIFAKFLRWRVVPSPLFFSPHRRHVGIATEQLLDKLFSLSPYNTPHKKKATFISEAL